MIFMIKNKLFNQLLLMYTLFGQTPSGYTILKSELASFIKTLGRETVSANTETAAAAAGALESTDEKKPPQSVWVDQILQLKLQFDTVLDKSFEKNIGFEAEINTAIQSIVALNPKNAEYISLYIDSYLRLVAKGKQSVVEFEENCDCGISIFRFLTEKDVFERYYKQHLAKRLLHVKNVSEDAEKSVLAKLKVILFVILNFLA